ncbi:CopG family transcriptional regulator [Leptolyngbya sp. FACHB-671]|uniref:CopG family transcriptional regulator n=1 Tax=Leptolyngbya sp. FACHB-671 TaxID=2692812 RepID=UPI001683BE7F|nr:CopG family transcriptional regulator [Leptolyngbya sp. FACHB-671]MBD2065951.1 CopG family transcriptional regulator [Leptolyngbya sp. FACHB-671]
MSPAKRQRKSLDSSNLASEFVYGDRQGSSRPAEPVEEPEEIDEPEEEPPQPEPKTPQKPPKQTRAKKPSATSNRSNLMSRLMESAVEKEPTIRLTVDMPQSMHQKLSILCARTGKKKAEVVRLLLEEALDEVNE